MTILRIAIPSPLRRLFDYLLPKHLTCPEPGVRIKVPFGNRQLIGMLIETSTQSDLPAEKLKPVLEILDDTPLIPAYMLDLMLWAADYYQHPIGDAVLQSIPVHLRKGNPCEGLHTYLWRATPDASEQQLSPRAHQQRKLFTLLQEHPAGISKEALEAEGAAVNLLSTLQTAGLAEKIRHHYAPPEPDHLLKEAPLVLNEEQARALAALDTQRGFQTLLLDGITGAGKTEVYLQAIHQVLKQGKQALILVPEIGLTPQTVHRFQSRFRVPVCVLHSHLTDKQRLDAWLQAREGEAPIIIGTRSAIFTPMRHPGMIIVDEEHDASFKQQDGYRYSARDLAVLRAHAEAIPVMLGSATPSLESLHNCQQQRYQHTTLRTRAGNAKPPQIHLLDIRREALDNGLSAPLLQTIGQHLAQGTQVLVFINRRGFAPSLICHDCGATADCKRCDARMTLHYNPAHLHCHHCGSQRPVPRQCSQCGSENIEPVGAGTERTEQALTAHFPNTPVIRVDRDSTARKGAMQHIMNEVNQGKPCILVGTQMLAKGHHFPKVTLVAIPDADAGLFSTDFRGMERTAQLILQVAGRAGRADHPGEVILQTHQSEHPLLRRLTQDGYEAFAQAELEQRRQYQLPPFTHMAILRAEASKPGRADSFLHTVKDSLQASLPYIHWSGPFPAPMEKRAGVYRAQLTFVSASRPALQHALSQICQFTEAHPLANRIRWSIDVDPYDTY